MTNAAKFLFGTDFRQPAPSAKPAAAFSEQELAEAEARGYRRGLAEGQRQGRAEADASVEARVAAAFEGLGGLAEALIAAVDRHCAETEDLALEFALALGRKLAGEALARDPLAGIAEAASRSFEHLRGVPHLVLRVNETLVEAVDALVKRMARERGFEGRLVTLGEPEIPPGDIRLEWADGGLVRDRARIERTVADILQQHR